MSYTGGTYTPPTGAENAAPGGVIRSATWNTIFTDMSAALTSCGPVSIEFVMRDGQSALSPGVKGFLDVPMKLTILGWKILADQSGSAVIDIWKAPFASFPPVSGNSITGSVQPTLSGAQGASGSTLTGWTTTIDAGDVLAFNVISCSASQQLTLVLDCGRAS